MSEPTPVPPPAAPPAKPGATPTPATTGPSSPAKPAESATTGAKKPDPAPPSGQVPSSGIASASGKAAPSGDAKGAEAKKPDPTKGDPGKPSAPAQADDKKSAAPAAATGKKPGIAPYVISAVILAAIGVFTSDYWLPFITGDDLAHRGGTKTTLITPPTAPLPPPVMKTAPTAAEPEAKGPVGGPVPLPDTVRLDRLEKKLADLEGAIAPVQQSVTGLGRKLDALAGTVAALPTTSTPAIDPATLQAIGQETRATAGELAKLGDRLAGLERRTAEKATDLRIERSLALAIGQINTALEGSGPFEVPVALMQALAGNDTALAPALASLVPLSKKGVPSRIALSQSLAKLPPLVAVAPPIPDTVGVWDKVGDSLARLVTVRRTDVKASAETTTPLSPEQIVLSAETVLTGGDLAGAIQTMKTIEGPQAAIIAPWLRDAEARLAAEKAAMSLSAIITSRLTAAGGAQ